MNKIFASTLLFLSFFNFASKMPLPIFRLVGRSAGLPCATYTRGFSQNKQMNSVDELRKKLESFNKENAKQS